VVVEDNWADYFAYIKPVCPWAYAAWQAGTIDIVYNEEPKDLGNYTARIYVVDIHNHDLRAYSEYLNDTRTDLWFYSDPEYLGYSTPVSCLIQQDPVKLEEIRQKTGTFNNKA